MRTRTFVATLAGALALTVGVTIGPASAVAGPEQRTEAQTRAFLDALERKDLDAVSAIFDETATHTLPLSFSGTQEPAAHFEGKEEVVGYVNNVFTNFRTIRFTDVRISVTDGGRTSFVQANGDFTSADGRPYRNVYVFRYDWRNGQIVRGEDYANPAAFCLSFPEAPQC